MIFTRVTEKGPSPAGSKIDNIVFKHVGADLYDEYTITATVKDEKLNLSLNWKLKKLYNFGDDSHNPHTISLPHKYGYDGDYTEFIVIRENDNAIFFLTEKEINDSIINDYVSKKIPSYKLVSQQGGKSKKTQWKKTGKFVYIHVKSRTTGELKVTKMPTYANPSKPGQLRVQKKKADGTKYFAKFKEVSMHRK